jgi:hypothetical protein
MADMKAGSADAIAMETHIASLTEYARSVASGVVPGWHWQNINLGFGISPCDGKRNEYLMPKADGPELLNEAEIINHGNS